METIDRLRQAMMQQFAKTRRLDDPELLRLSQQVDQWIIWHQYRYRGYRGLPKMVRLCDTHGTMM